MTIKISPVYIAEMLLLPETALEMNKFQEGGHIVKRSENTSFNTVWSDLGLEQSVVKDWKSRKRGIIGCSRENTATTKWYFIVHEGAAVVRNLKRMCGFNDYKEIIHRDMIPLAIKESEKNVQTIISVIRGRFGNTFQFEPENDEISPLIYIASGVVLQADVAGAFLIAREPGREAMIDFVGKRINSNSETLDKIISLCRQTELCLGGLLSSHSKERFTFRNHLVMSLQVYLWLLQILMAHCRKPTRRKSCMF